MTLQSRFASQLKGLSRIQLRSNIDSFLQQDRSIPLIVRIWLRCLRTRFVPLGFSKMMLLNLLRARSSRLLWSQKKKARHYFQHQGRKLMRKTKIY